jgi:hypothetical protein
MKVSKKELRKISDKIAAMLTEVESLRCLIGRRVVGVGFNGEREGAYRLEFDDGSTAEFSSVGDDMTFTSVTLSEFQKSAAKRHNASSTVQSEEKQNGNRKARKSTRQGGGKKVDSDHSLE